MLSSYGTTVVDRKVLMRRMTVLFCESSIGGHRRATSICDVTMKEVTQTSQPM